MIEINNITKSFDGKIVLNNTSICIKDNCLTVILGPSGCGKTTLLNIISSNFTTDYNTNVRISNLVYYQATDMNINLLSVVDNLKLVSNDLNLINKILDDLKILNLKNKKVSKLSKGQQQRVSIARALISKENIILFDEITSNLDEETSELIFKIIKDYSNTKTIVLVTHDEINANKYGTNLYKIIDKKLVQVKEEVTKDIIVTKENTIDNKISSKVLIKYDLKKTFRNYFLALINLILVIASVSLLALGNAFSNIDYIKTSQKILENTSSELFYGSDKLFKEDISEKEYMTENECAQVISLYWGSNSMSSVDSIFYEDYIKINKNFDKILTDYNISYQNTSTNLYYPVIVSSQYKKTYAEKTNKICNIGDIIPFSFSSSSSKVQIHYVIVDIIEKDLDNIMFPLIIPKQSYYDMITYNGIEDGSLSSMELTKEYNNSFNSINRVSYIDKDITKASTITNLKPYDPNDTSSGYYYIGRLPQADNEIMISSFYDYVKYTGDNSYTNFDINLNTEFISKYKDGLPMKILNKPYNVKIVGAVSYCVNGEYSSKYNCTIINESLYDDFMNKILNEDKVIYQSSNNHYYSKDAIVARNLDIYEGNLILSNSEFSNYQNMLSFEGFSNTMYYISYVLIALTLLVSVLYSNGIIKSMDKDIALLKTFNTSKTNLLKLISYEIAILIIPFIIAIPISNIFVKLIASLNEHGYHNVLSFKFGISYISIFITFVLYVLIIILPIIISNKKKNLIEK